MLERKICPSSVCFGYFHLLLDIHIIEVCKNEITCHVWSSVSTEKPLTFNATKIQIYWIFKLCLCQVLPVSLLLNYSLAAFIFCHVTSNIEHTVSIQYLLTMFIALWMWCTRKRIHPNEGGDTGTRCRSFPRGRERLIGRAVVYACMGHMCVQRTRSTAETLLSVYQSNPDLWCHCYLLSQCH